MVPSAAALSLALALPLAWLVDQRFGEPRNVLHPAALFGTAMRPIGRWLQCQRAPFAWAGGASAWLVAVSVVGAVAWTRRANAWRVSSATT